MTPIPTNYPLPPLNFFDLYYKAFHYPFFFIIGACLGSFFNVCIYRIPRGMSLSYPGSHCYRCGRPVKWYDNIPLLSYWILRGHCRHCGASFSIRYFVVELLTALLFTLTYHQLGPSLALLPGFLFVSLLIIATFTDLDHWIIPDRISLGGLAAGLLLAAIWPVGLAPHNPLAAPGDLLELFWSPPRTLTPLVSSALGALGGLAIMWGIGALGSLIFRKEAMGWGDIKLFTMFGAFCGLEPLIYILVISCLLGTLAGIIGIYLGRQAARRPVDPAVAPLVIEPELADDLLHEYPLGEEECQSVERALTKPGAQGPIRHHLPFGPSLAIAAIVVFLFGDLIRHWFTSLMLGGSPYDMIK